MVVKMVKKYVVAFVMTIIVVVAVAGVAVVVVLALILAAVVVMILAVVVVVAGLVVLTVHTIKVECLSRLIPQITGLSEKSRPTLFRASRANNDF